MIEKTSVGKSGSRREVHSYVWCKNDGCKMSDPANKGTDTHTQININKGRGGKGEAFGDTDSVMS
jgi:hypothetical protein